MIESVDKSVIEFLPYQRRFFQDTARVQVALWCRQAGKDFTTAAKAVDKAILKGQKWFIVATTQSQADSTLEKCNNVAKAYKEAFKIGGRITIDSNDEYIDYDAAIDEAFRCKAHTLNLPGGGSVTSMPGRNPDSLAGRTGNVIFTEFGLFPKGGYDHWRVVFPLCTRGYQVIVISTPRGKNTKFYELFAKPELYAVHFVDIYKAVADGHVLTDNNGRPTTIEKFRELYGDEAGWAREYECKFTGDLETLLKWAQICAAGEMGRKLPFDFLRVENDAGWKENFFAPLAAEEGRCEIGWDVARSGDLSALWINQAIVNRPRALRALVLMHNTTFAMQRKIVSAAMDCNRRNVGTGDATGLGMDSNETLATKYPKRWQSFTFSATGKREIGSLLKTAYDDADQAIPPADGEHKAVGTDLYAVQKEGDAQTLKLTEGENPLWPESHCDVAYSCGLARKAAQIVAPRPYISV